MKHKLIPLAVFLFALFIAADSQTNTDLAVIKAAFDSDIGKKVAKGGLVIYADSTRGCERLKKQLKKFSVSKAIKDLHHPDKILLLSRDEQRLIVSELDSIRNFCWPENLFARSKRVPWKELLSYAKYEPAYDSLTKRWANDSYVYSFSKPVYIRNGTIAYFGMARMCGGDCGQDEEAFYKYENGKWVKFISLGTGEF